MLGRTLVRVEEVIDACDIIIQALDLMPEGEIQAKFPRKVPEVRRRRAWRRSAAN